jgi:hypothetical protein
MNANGWPRKEKLFILDAIKGIVGFSEVRGRRGSLLRAR